MVAATVLYMTRQRWLASFARLPKAQYHVAVDRSLPVPMRDGTILLADHYYPKTKGTFPTILIRSPWGRGWENTPLSLAYLFVAGRFAERGYHVVGRSPCTRPDPADAYYPVHEGDDGLAVLAWIAEQPWCSGAVGCWGASYLGYVQWASAVHAPVLLKALVPISTTACWSAFFYHDGALALERLLNIVDTTSLARLSPVAIFGRLLSQPRRVAAAAMHLPLLEADAVLLGAENPGYRAVLAHPPSAESYWRPLDLDQQLGQVTANVHLIAGWYDIFLRQQLADYAVLVAAGRNPYLTIGPWRHTDSELSGAGIREGLAWFDAHLAGRTHALRSKPVRVFVRGANTWLDLRAWPPPSNAISYYLGASQQLLGGEARQSGQDSFCYDPADPTPALGGAQLSPGASVIDNAALETRKDVLVYTSAPLTADLLVIGAPSVTLCIHADAMSADYFVRLCCVDSSGRSANVCDGFARVDNSGQSTERTVVQLNLEPTAMRFRTGERLRVLIAGGAHPRWNRNSSAPDWDFSSMTLAAANQTVYYGPAQQSVIDLPVVYREEVTHAA
jgi:putative CocE/NonD family hydrolase